MKWKKPPDRDYPPKTVKEFAWFPTTLYYHGIFYRIWLEWYETDLVWADNAWGKGYARESSRPIFKQKG